MAQRLRIDSLCDVCLHDDTETPADTYHVSVTIEGEPASPRPFDVELCGQHGAELAKAVLAVMSYGRPPEERKASGRQRPDTVPGQVTCPECGESRNSISSLRVHVRREHDKSLAGVGFYPANVTCPECGDGFPNRQGAAAHMRTAHPGSKQTA